LKKYLSSVEPTADLSPQARAGEYVTGFSVDSFKITLIICQQCCTSDLGGKADIRG
jgi:hypothetical protein